LITRTPLRLRIALHTLEEHFVLIDWRDMEVVKDQDEDEDVINAQGFLDQEAGEKL
jgi:hypothetical protein